MITEAMMKQAEVVWNFHLMHHDMKPCDAIFALGSNDPRVAEHAAQLFLDGYAPLLIFSGGVGKLTEGQYGCSEADYFAKIAIAMGVPKDRIIIEPKSTNTGENITFTKQILDDLNLELKTFILVQKPFMERRSYATFRKQWPNPEIIVTSPKISLIDYPTPDLSMEDILNVMVGDLQRIIEYPKLGFQIPMDVPQNVVDAMNDLISHGINKHLIS